VDYPGVRALDAVSMQFRSGEIHAVVGENGAGKSTLMKVLSGSLRPTTGGIRVHGREAAFGRPLDAMRAGISMVHQELNIVPTLDVAENVCLGREPVGLLGLKVRHAAQRARARELLALLGSSIDVGRSAAGLSVAEAQFVEIAKCLASDARVLILDEPTAVLGEHEARQLLRLMQRLRDEGRAIVFISHHLDEVVAIADRVSVLRDGKLVHSFARGTRDGAASVLRDGEGIAVDESRIASAMVGRELGSIYPAKGVAVAREPVLELVGFGALGRSQGITLSVSPGEIVGIAGLVGSGRTETAEAIVGLRPHVGALRVHGEERSFDGSASARRAGVAYVSEDRKGRGLHVSLSSIENMTLPSLERHVRAGGLLIDRASERAVTSRWIDAFSIRCARPELPISSLSGGNQQKFALARWLEVAPTVLVIDEPTRGVDVGARAEIHAEVRRLAAAGSAVVFASSELEEVLLLADRVLVMHEGAIAGELAAHEATEVAIMHLATGGAAPAHRTGTHA